MEMTQLDLFAVTTDTVEVIAPVHRRSIDELREATFALTAQGATLRDMDEAARLAWTNAVMAVRMERLAWALEDGFDVHEHAKGVAYWATTIAATTAEPGTAARLYNDATHVLTLASHPLPGDAVEITWGRDAD